MNVTATELANHSKSILDQVIFKGQEAIVQRHGKPVAELRRKPGISRAELVRRLKECPFTAEETEQFQRILEEANKVYADSH